MRFFCGTTYSNKVNTNLYHNSSSFCIWISWSAVGSNCLSLIKITVIQDVLFFDENPECVKLLKLGSIAKDCLTCLSMVLFNFLCVFFFLHYWNKCFLFWLIYWARAKRTVHYFMNRIMRQLSSQGDSKPLTVEKNYYIKSFDI